MSLDYYIGDFSHQFAKNVGNQVKKLENGVRVIGKNVKTALHWLAHTTQHYAEELKLYIENERIKKDEANKEKLRLVERYNELIANNIRVVEQYHKDYTDQMCLEFDKFRLEQLAERIEMMEPLSVYPDELVRNIDWLRSRSRQLKMLSADALEEYKKKAMETQAEIDLYEEKSKAVYLALNDKEYVVGDTFDVNESTLIATENKLRRIYGAFDSELGCDGLSGGDYYTGDRVKKEEQQVIPKKIEKDRFTVAEKIASIRQILAERKKIKFSEFAHNDYTKSEMINLFLAILELLKMQEIRVLQKNTFEDIDIETREEDKLNAS